MQQTSIYLYRWIMWNVFSRLFVRFYLGPAITSQNPKTRLVFRSRRSLSCLTMERFSIPGSSDTTADILCHHVQRRGVYPGQRIELVPQQHRRVSKEETGVRFQGHEEDDFSFVIGYPVCISPRARRAGTANQLMYKGIEKIVRRCRASLVMPRYRQIFSPSRGGRMSSDGRIVVTYDVVSPERIRDLSDDDLFGLMKAGIAHSDIKDPANRPEQFSATTCPGSGALRVMCPACKRKIRSHRGQRDPLRLVRMPHGPSMPHAD